MRKMLPIVVSLALSFNIFANDNLYKQKTQTTPSINPPSSIQNNTRTQDWILYMLDSYGDGWNGASLDLLINGEVVLDDATVTGSEETVYFTVDDGDAVNYDMFA